MFDGSADSINWRRKNLEIGINWGSADCISAWIKCSDTALGGLSSERLHSTLIRREAIAIRKRKLNGIAKLVARALPRSYRYNQRFQR